ncbi:MAG: hypothetical protein A2169_07195 [Deltaproteobacteria bacterium RBG_13_47_9]|nr:MAG: hypothetical protein A2169_07195 [Deltaproteobacteria bacterium RBG_13_47_9]
MNHLIRCVNCDAILFKTPFDQWPEYEFGPNSSPGSFRTIEKDDYQDFLRNHQGHRLEELTIIDDSFVSEKPYIEPVKVSYFKATNGSESFVIKKYRKNIANPLEYKLIYGDFHLKCLSIEVLSEEIKKQLLAECPGLSEEKAESFIRICQDIPKVVDIKNLEKVPEESSHPLEIYYQMDDVTGAHLLRRCRNAFQGKEYLDIEDFINRHRDNSVLLFKAIHKIEIAEVSKPKKEIRPLAIPVESKKILKKR